MPGFGYDPYQKDMNVGGLLGDTGGGILKFLMMMGMGGKGPLAGLLGMGSETTESPGVTQQPGPQNQGPMGQPLPQQPMPEPRMFPQPQMPPGPGMAGPQMGGPQQGMQQGMQGIDPQMIQQLMRLFSGMGNRGIGG